MNSIAYIEDLLQKEAEAVPFHNLFMLHGLPIVGSPLGGTCSDKVLHFQKVLSHHGIASWLHSANINGIPCHRLLTVLIEGRRYFIDVGSGWPSIKIFPEDAPISYQAFGMGFKSVVDPDTLHIYHEAGTEYKLQCKIHRQTQNEVTILENISARFADISIYPFANSLRFSKVKDGEFYFLKGNRLRIYGREKFVERNLDGKQVVEFLKSESQIDQALLQHVDICRWLLI